MSYPHANWLSKCCVILLTIMPIFAWSSTFAPPSVSTVGVPATNIYTFGQHIDFIVTLDQAVNVTLGTESPYIPITLDAGTNAKAVYYSGTGTNSLIFRYTVAATHKDNNGIVLGNNIILSNSTILNGSNESINLTLNGVAPTSGLKVDGLVPKLIYNTPVGIYPTTKRDIQFVLKFNRPVIGLSLNSFEIAVTPSITANLTSFKKVNDSVYHVWVTDQTTSSNYTGSIQLNIKSAFTSIIKDSINQDLDASTITMGTSAAIQFPLPITINAYQPTPSPFAGGIVDILGSNLGRVDKVIIGGVEGKILLNDDIRLKVLVMPGSDTLAATLKIVRGADTIFPILNNEVYKVLTTNFPNTSLNQLEFFNASNTKSYTNFAIDKNGKFAILCDEYDNMGAGACAFFINDYSVYLNQKVGWRQVGQKFRYPNSSINNAAFGAAIAIGANENHIAITAKNAASGRGEVIIYKVNIFNYNNNAPIDSILTVDQILTGLNTGDDFGASIEFSADGNTLMVSAPSYDINKGAVFVYKKSFEVWNLLPILLKPSDAVGSAVNFGSTIALSADGEKYFIAATNDNSGKGAVWGFQNVNTNWTQIGTKITGSNYTNTANFGSSIALSANANKIIIGASNENNTKGAVYIYNRSNNLITQLGNPLTDTTDDNTSEFGASISMSANGDVFAVSAPLNNRGAYFVYGIQKDSIELLSSTINKSLDSSIRKKVSIDYQGNNLLTEISYTNGERVVAGFESLTKPILRSLNKSIISSNTNDTIVAKLFNAKSVNKIIFADSIQLQYQTLTDTTIAIQVDTAMKLQKGRLNFRYGIDNNYSDTVVVDKIRPTVKILLNQVGLFKDTVVRVKLRFSERISTNIIANFPVLPNGVNGLPTARLDSVKADTAGFVYTGYFKALIEGPIFFNNLNTGTFNDSVGNSALSIPNSDTIVFDKTTYPPLLYVGKLTTNLYDIDMNLPETKAPGTLKLNFHDFATDTIFHTWILSNTISSTKLTYVNLLDNPTTNPFVTAVYPAGSQLRNGKYKLRLAYQDSLFNPIASSNAWDVAYRDSLPTIYTYTPDINNFQDPLTLKGVNFLNIDSIKIGNQLVQHTVLSDSILTIGNKTGVVADYLNFYYDSDSTLFDRNLKYGAQNANNTNTINQSWQKFYNQNKARLDYLFFDLQNTSTTIDNKLVVEVYKDTVVTSSLNPTVKFTSSPLAVSDTLTLFRMSPMFNNQFTFSNDTLILEDSTNYFIVLKQLNNPGDVNFKILVDQNNSKSGANDGNNVDLKYQIVTRPFILMDKVRPTVNISFNQPRHFKDSLFQVKLRFSKKIATIINNSYFPIMPNVFNGLGLMARFDSVRTDTAGLVYTGFFKALNNGPIFFNNPNAYAFEDLAGNISLPIPNSDTITYDNVTLTPIIYSTSTIVDSLLINYSFPEPISPGTANLIFTNISTGMVEATWNLSNSINDLIGVKVDPFADPTTFSFVSSVYPAGARLTYGNYRMKVVYQDLLLNPVASSENWDVRIVSQMPIVYDYTPTVNSANNLFTLKGINFSYVDSVQINNQRVPFTSPSDSVLNINDKTGATTGFINFYYNGDSTMIEYNKIYGAINASNQYVINTTWQKFYNTYRGALTNVKLKLLNNSTTVDNKIVLEIYKDTLATNSLDPSLKFNNQPISISDTLTLLRNTNVSVQNFTFTNALIVLNDSTNYYIVLKQLNQVGASSSKIIGESSTLKNGAINGVLQELYYEVSTKPYIIIDTLPPVANIVNQNLSRYVSGPFWLDVVFNKPVIDILPNQTLLIPSIRNGQITATTDSIVTILSNIWYRQHFTPKEVGKILLFNFDYGVTRDLIGNIAMPIGMDSVFYIGNDFKLEDYHFPYNRSGNTVRLVGKGFTYLTEITYNNQVIADTVLNDSTIEITLPPNAISGKIVLRNLAGDSTNNKINTISSSGNALARIDTSFIPLIPTHTGAVDSLQFYLTNPNTSNTSYFVDVYSHNGNRIYKRMIARSDTVQLIANASQSKVNFTFNNQNNVVFKDSIYYIKLIQVGTSPTMPTILTGSSGQVKYSYAVNAKILVNDSGLNVAVSNNAVNGYVDGPYYIDFRFNRPLRYVNLPLMLPGLDENNQVLARVDSTIISDDGLLYRQHISPLKKGKILFFNAFFGTGIDYFGINTAPFGFDTVNYANTRKPIVLNYDKDVVSAGRIIQVVGKNLSNTKLVKVNDVNASFYVINEDSLIFIAPLNSGSGRIQLLDENNEFNSNFVDTFYRNANAFNLTTNAWQKITSSRTGLFSKIGIFLNNGATNNSRFNLRLYKTFNPSANNFSDQFDSLISISDTITVTPGPNRQVQFSFNQSSFIASKDSSYYFVLNQLDATSNVQIQFETSNGNTGSIGGQSGNMQHTLELVPYLVMDTSKPIPSLTTTQRKIAGPFFIDLNFSEPVMNLAPNPIIVNPGQDNLPKARLDSVKTVQAGIKYRYFYTPKSEGTITFSIPFFGIAADMAGNVATNATSLSLKYIDTNYNNLIRANGDLNICNGDSLSLLATVDSAFSIQWNTGDITRSIMVKKAGQYFFKIVVNETTDFNSDTLQVKVNELPVTPSIRRNNDSLISTSFYGNKWYKNSTKMTDTTRSIKPAVSDYYAVQVDLNNCTSPISTVYYYLITNVTELNNNTIAIVPNPFTDYVVINHNKAKGQLVQLEIIQLSDGLRVHTQPLIESSSKIYLNKLISGIYLFNLIDNKGKIIAQYKMVKL